MVIDCVANENNNYWHDMKYGPPPIWERVIVFYPNKNWGSRKVIDYWEGHTFAEQFKYGNPSHWRPVPIDPELETDNENPFNDESMMKWTIVGEKHYEVDS